MLREQGERGTGLLSPKIQPWEGLKHPGPVLVAQTVQEVRLRPRHVGVAQGFSGGNNLALAQVSRPPRHQWFPLGVLRGPRTPRAVGQPHPVVS